MEIVEKRLSKVVKRYRMIRMSEYNLNTLCIYIKMP